MQVKNFHLTLQTETPTEILKILIFNFPFVIPFVKNTQIPKLLNFNLTLQMESPTEIKKILIFKISLVILLVKLN